MIYEDIWIRDMIIYPKKNTHSKHSLIKNKRFDDDFSSIHMNPYDYPQEETILAQEKLILVFLIKLYQSEMMKIFILPHCFAYALRCFRFVFADLLYGTSLRSFDGDDQGADPLGPSTLGPSNVGSFQPLQDGPLPVINGVMGPL